MLADLTSRVLAAASPALTETMTEAERLSGLHSERLGTRSLDALHVAAPIVLGLGEFLSFDRLWLARVAGLKAPAWE
jgi:predicted nucleic acid-binding protein